MLQNGARFHINDALYSRKSIRNLLMFKDIRRNGYHIEQVISQEMEFAQVYILANFLLKNSQPSSLGYIIQL